MPLESPKSPVQHLHHHASGFSIPGRLPCLLAVVLGLFAHSEALAQRLNSLTITGTDGDVTVTPSIDPADFDPDRFNYTVTAANAVTSLIVDADSSDGSVDYLLPDGTVIATDAATVDPVPAGTTRITVRVTLTGSTQTQNYVITVTRPRDLTLSSLTVTESEGGSSSVTLTPEFVSGTRNSAGYAGTVVQDVTQVTVTATATSGTAELTWDPRDAETVVNYQRNLNRGRNTIRLSVRDGGQTAVYTINLTRTYRPGPPRSLTATAVDVGKQVTLSWTAPADDGGEDITGYEYVQYLSAQAEMPNYVPLETDWQAIVNSGASTTSHTVTGLTNGTTYYFRVRAENTNGKGSGSPEASTTPASAPLALGGVMAEGGNARVKLTWNLPTDRGNPISNYQYRQRAGSAGSYGGWTNIPNSGVSTTATTASYTVTSLRNGTTYYFQVRATNHVGRGGDSEEVDATPQAGVPGVPTGLTAEEAGDEEVTLSWRTPADNGGEPITGYEYSQATESGPPPDTPDDWTATSGTGTTFTVTSGVENGGTYYFRVRARNSNGPSLASEEASATLIARPAAPTGLMAMAPAHGGEVRLTWTASADIGDNSKYQYVRRAGTGSDGNWIDIPNGDLSTDGQSRSYTVTGLANGTAYTFKVRAVNLPDRESLASGEASATPRTTPGAPTVRATAGDDQVTLSWTAPSDDGGAAISYYVYEVRHGADAYMPTGGNGARIPNSGASTRTHTFEADDDVGERLDGLAVGEEMNGTAFTFRVWAVNAVTGEMGAVNNKSNQVTVTPSDTPGTGRTFDISATIDGKSWAEVGTSDPIQVVVTVNPAFAAPTTDLHVGVNNGSKTAVTFRPGDTTRSVSIPSTGLGVGTHSVALFPEADSTEGQALKVTEVSIRATGATPDMPANPRGTAGDGYVTLSWTASSTENTRTDRYEYRQKAGTGPYGSWRRISNLNSAGSSRSHRVTGLTNGTTYTFQVRAVRSDEGTPPVETPSEASNEVTVSLGTTAVPPGAPTNVIATPGNAQVALSWSAPADGGAAISRYEYKQETTSGGNLGRWTTTGGTGTTYTVTGLTNGTPYYFQVRAVNRVGNGPASVVASTTPALTATDTTLRTLTVSPGTLTPAFTAATRSYSVTVGSGVSEVTVAAAPTKSTATATITPVDANPTAAGHQVAVSIGVANIRVRVQDGTTTGDYTVAVTRTGALPAAPTGLAATAGDGEVTLSWTAAASGATAITRYQYQQRVGANAYGLWRDIPNSGASTMSYTVPGLTNGTAYTFRVRAVNSAGAGAESTEATATPTTARLVWAKSEPEVAAVIAAAMAAGLGDDMTFDAGEQIEILGSALFNAAEGVTLSYTAVSSDSAIASAGIIDAITVTVTAVTGGMADITITATATPPSGLTINPQTSPREASITFPVEVDIEALMLELVGPTDMNLVEGGRDHANGTAGRATVTVRANRPVTREVTVTLLVDRAVSDATADDFEAAPIVLGAGATAGSTVVTAVDDGTAEGREVLVLFGMAADNAGEVQGEVTLHLFDAAVPALPLVAQLLLAAFLAIGGYRRYRRR